MNSKFYKGLAAVAIAAGFASCSDDYLQTEPITSISDATAVATTEAAQMTVYGISRIMNTQNDQGRSHTGENSCLQWIGEGLGPDNVSFMNMNEMGRSWSRWESLNLPSSSLCKTMWGYCYMIISRANTVLATIDAADGTQAEKDWIKAQCLTFRPTAICMRCSGSDRVGLTATTAMHTRWCSAQSRVQVPLPPAL